MAEWLRAITGGLSFGELLLAIVLPVVGFVLVAVGLRALYERLALRPRAPRRVWRSSIGLPLSELEKIAHDFYRSQGYEVISTSELAGTHREMIAVKDEQRTLIWCLEGQAVPEPQTVEDVAEARAERRAHRAVLLSPAGFTSDVRQRALNRGVELRDRTQLDVMRRVAERHAQP